MHYNSMPAGMIYRQSTPRKYMSYAYLVTLLAHVLSNAVSGDAHAVGMDALLLNSLHPINADLYPVMYTHSACILLSALNPRYADVMGDNST